MNTRVLLPETHLGHSLAPSHLAPSHLALLLTTPQVRLGKWIPFQPSAMLIVSSNHLISVLVGASGSAHLGVVQENGTLLRIGVPPVEPTWPGVLPSFPLQTGGQRASPPSSACSRSNRSQGAPFCQCTRAPPRARAPVNQNKHEKASQAEKKKRREIQNLCLWR